MKIENSTKTFKGGFHFKNLNEYTKNNVKYLIKGNKKRIFYDLLEKGDVFLITHDNDNHKIVNFIKSNKLAFDFYPKINTTNCEKQSNKLIDMIAKQKNLIIKNVDLIKSPIKSSISLTRAINIVSRSLRLNIESPIIKKNDEVMTTIRDNAKERNINIILTKGNAYYVEVTPDSSHTERTYAILNPSGKFPKICEDIDDRLKFMKKFKSLKDEKANILYKYKVE